MSLLDPPGFSAPSSSSLSPWTHSAPLLMGTELPAHATPQGERQFGRTANSPPLTGYEPKFDVEVNSEYTPIIFPEPDRPISARE